MSFNSQITVGAGANTDATAQGIIRVIDGVQRREAHTAEPCRFDWLPLTKLIGYIIDKHHVYARRQVAAIGALLADLAVTPTTTLTFYGAGVRGGVVQSFVYPAGGSNPAARFFYAELLKRF